jgi:thiamine biosynthesis lipoprotein
MGLLLLVLTLLAPFPYCTERVFYLMGTYAVIDLPDEERIYRTYMFMRSIEEKISTFREDSEISELIRNAGKGYVKVSEETEEVLRISLRVYKKTYGYFDITLGSGGPASIRVERGRAYLSEGVTLDLGGIGKGYAVEKASAYAGTPWGFIAIAGDMKVWGHKRPLAIRDPLGEGSLLQMINAKDLCLSTSGNYIREHIVQRDRDLVQITVVYTDCSLADAYATALFSMPRDLRRKFYRENPEVGSLEVFADGSLYMNPAFLSYFETVVFKKKRNLRK